MADVKIIDRWSDIGVHVSPGRGKLKVKCPNCLGTRSNKTDKSLSINATEGVSNCHYCGVSYVIKKEFENKMNEYTSVKKIYKRPIWQNKTDLSDAVVKYFEDRKISQITLQKARVTEGVTFMPQQGKICKTIQFNFFLNSELVNIKHRTRTKDFKLESGAELILYNIDSVKGKKEVIITEGEIDALSFIECGFDSVVSLPNGASENTSYLDNYLEEYLDDKEVIYLAVDTDKKGLLCRQELTRRLGSDRCKVVTYGDGCKDANEHLMKFGKESLKLVISGAQDIKIEGVFELSDIQSQVDLLYSSGLQKGYLTGHPHLDNLITWETGRLCIITGIPGHGKSEFADELTVRLNIRYGLKFAYFSPENHPLAYLIAKLTSKFIGKSFGASFINKDEYIQACTHINDNFFFIYPEKDFTLDSIIERADYLVRKKGIKGLVIDPYNTIEHKIPNGMSETNYISALLSTLTEWARKNDVLVFLIAHPRKMDNKGGKITPPNLYDINGSANFFNKADFGLTVFRNYIEETAEIHVHKVKFKHLGRPGQSRFLYDINSGRYNPYWGQADVVWDNSNYLAGTSVEVQPPYSLQEQAFTQVDQGELPF